MYCQCGKCSRNEETGTCRAGKNAAVSRIVPLHPEGTVVSVPRTYVNYVVTEYGVVNLLGKSQRERAALLISLAHADFRDVLRREATRLFWP